MGEECFNDFEESEGDGLTVFLRIASSSVPDPKKMAVRIEFYGIPRHRAGMAFCEVEATNLGEVFAEVVRTVPQLAESCFNGNQLQTGYLANINGKTFTTDPETPLKSGDSVLILSADVGG